MTGLPHICAVCCTFGRVAELQEAIACFLAQDYQGRKTLVVFNSLTDQTLTYAHPEVVIVNAKERPPTMGATRNAAIDHAPDDSLIVTWDDDDRYCSNHLSNFTRGFNWQWGWVRHSRQFHMEAGNLKCIVHGSANTVAFTKAAWLAVGGYNETHNTGEDRAFITKVSAQFPGATVDLQDGELSFCYGWAQGLYHLSGGGDDRLGMPTGMDRCNTWVRQRQEAGYEPRGSVELKPKLLRDYDGMARKFTSGVAKLSSGRRGKIALVSLGHAGDLLNVLPIAKHIHDSTGVKPLFFTSKMYGDVLDGVSYLEPVKLDLHDKDIRLAIAEAEKRCEYVLPTQVHGEGYRVDRVCESYNEEAWRMAGMMQHFSNLVRFPLVLDRRSAEREEKLLSDWHFKQPKNCLLINVRGGLSSPWIDGQAMQDALIAADHAGIETYLDLSKIRAERLYDMLAILERGSVLVSSDTYTLHLAAACAIPVIAIVNDNPQPFGRQWLRTKLRYKCLLKLGYSEAMSRIDEIHAAIESV